MIDYIERKAALRETCADCNCADDCNRTGDRCTDYARIELIPAADVRPVVRGEWEETTEENGWEEVKCASCSVCGDSYILDEWGIDDLKEMLNFCPNCGADMRKPPEVSGNA